MVKMRVNRADLDNGFVCLVNMRVNRCDLPHGFVYLVKMRIIGMKLGVNKPSMAALLSKNVFWRQSRGVAVSVHCGNKAGYRNKFDYSNKAHYSNKAYCTATAITWGCHSRRGGKCLRLEHAYECQLPNPVLAAGKFQIWCKPVCSMLSEPD